MWIEFLMAALGNTQKACTALSIIMIVALGATFLFAPLLLDMYDKLTPDSLWRGFKIWAIVFFFVGAFSLVPDIDDIWRVRIGMIKLQLASPENIQKGADVIERIGQKLECKYLGCDEEKKP